MPFLLSPPQLTAYWLEAQLEAQFLQVPMDVFVQPSMYWVELLQLAMQDLQDPSPGGHVVPGQPVRYSPDAHGFLDWHERQVPLLAPPHPLLYSPSFVHTTVQLLQVPFPAALQFVTY